MESWLIGPVWSSTMAGYRGLMRDQRLSSGDFCVGTSPIILVPFYYFLLLFNDLYTLETPRLAVWDTLSAS